MVTDAREMPLPWMHGADPAVSWPVRTISGMEDGIRKREERGPDGGAGLPAGDDEASVEANEGREDTEMKETAEKKTRPVRVETADIPLQVLRVIGPDGYARCGSCGVRLVNVEERIKCRYCWYCGKQVKWK